MAIDQSPSVIQHFSTAALPERARFDGYMSVLENSLWQVSSWDDFPNFNVALRAAPLGCLTVVAHAITRHHSHRTRADVDRSQERNCHLFVSVEKPWAFTHNGRHERLDPGDVVIFGEGEHETHAPDGFKGVIVKCPESWMDTWVGDSASIIGRNLRRDSKWGSVLSPMLQQLTPEFVIDAPLPPSVLADQLGSVLALMAGDTERHAMPLLLEKIRTCIREQCVEATLSAEDVASSLGIPLQDLHRTLLAGRSTFPSELRRARVQLARRTRLRSV